MILFNEDWAKYPKAVAQNTKNKSWIHMHEVYVAAGICNTRWHLQLLDPTLLDVDTRSPDLTPEEVARIRLECYSNPLYLLREVLRVPLKGSMEIIFIKADRGVLASVWLYLNHINTTNTQLRQSGKTFKGYLIFVWLLFFRLSNSTVLWSTTTDDKRRDSIKDIRGILSTLNPLIFEPLATDSRNFEMITNNRDNNIGNFVLAQKDKKAAEVKYLGFGIANQFWDELAEAYNSDISLGAAAGSSNDAIEQAVRQGGPWASMYLCTAPNLLKKEGANYHRLQASGAPWSEAFLDATNHEDLLDLIEANGGDRDIPSVDVTLSYKQLGKTEEEFRVILKRSMLQSNGDMDMVKRHCYSIPTYGSKDKPVSPAQAEVMLKYVQTTFHTEVTKEKAFIRYYSTMEEVMEINDLNRLMITIDTSTARGKDSCSITWTDIMTLKVLARCDIKRMMLGMFETMVCYLLTQYDKSVFVVEAKSTGDNLLDALVTKCHILGIDAFKRIYNTIYQDTTRYAKMYDTIRSTPVNRRSIQWYAGFKGYFGFPTNSHLRGQLFSQCLNEAVERAGSKLYDKTLVGQLISLEVDKHDRIDHPVGGHDDAAISFLFGVWFVLYGRNFALYGINPKDVLAKAYRGVDGEDTKEAVARGEAIITLERKVESLVNLLSANINTPVAAKYIALIERINKELEGKGSEVRNVDSLLANMAKR